MELLLEHRVAGDATVVTARGRIVAGAESEALGQCLDAVIPLSPHVVLHLGAIEFIDSCGLGLLVRYLLRAQNASGSMTVCAVSPKLADVLRVTRLSGLFQIYDDEAGAVAGVHRSAPDSAALEGPMVLCVDESPDTGVYLKALLKEAGYRATAVSNLPDALILLKATRPKVVVVSAHLRAARNTGTAAEFNRLAQTRAVVELPPGFSSRDAVDAAGQVLQGVRAAMG